MVSPSCSNRLRFCVLVPSSCSTRSHRQGQDIYTDGSYFGNFSKTSSPACVLLCRLRSPGHPLITSDLPLLVSVAVNGNLLRRCRRSELIAELGYEFDPLCILFTSDSEHKVNAMFLTTYEIILSSETSIRLGLIRKFRVGFPPNSSRTDRVVEIGLTDLA